MRSAREKIKHWASVAFSLTILAVIGWGVYEVARTFWSAFTLLNATVAAGIIAAVATVLVSVVSVLISKHLEQRNNVLKELRDKKVPVYEELIEFVFRIFFGEKIGQVPLTDAEMAGKMSSITQRLIVWGSDEVVHEFYMFRRFANREQDGSAFTALSIEKIFLAIRKDLGHQNKGLTPGKILGTFINDIHQLFKP